MKATKSSISNLVFCGIMTVICLVGAWYGGKWLLAESYSKAAVAQLETWRDVNLPVFAEDWYALIDSLERAAELDPRNANIHYQLGTAYLLGQRVLLPRDESLSAIDQMNVFLATRQGFIHQALAAFWRSVELRPLDMYAWLEITLAKGRLEEYDREFYLAYEKTMTLGENLEYFQTNLTLVSARNFEAIQSDLKTQNLQLAHFAKVLTGNRIQAHLGYLAINDVVHNVCQQLAKTGISWGSYMQTQCMQAELDSESALFPL